MRKQKRKSAFKKDVKLLKKRGKDMIKLDALIALLTMEIPLPASCREHALHGTWEGSMDSHVEGDWILIYEINDNADPKEVTFHRTGTHSDLF